MTFISKPLLCEMNADVNDGTTANIIILDTKKKAVISDFISFGALLMVPDDAMAVFLFFSL